MPHKTLLLALAAILLVGCDRSARPRRFGWKPGRGQQSSAHGNLLLKNDDSYYEPIAARPHSAPR